MKKYIIKNRRQLKKIVLKWLPAIVCVTATFFCYHQLSKKIRYIHWSISDSIDSLQSEVLK